MAFLTLQYHISIRAEFCRGSWLLMSNCSLPRGGSWFSIIANPRPSVCKSHCPALIGPWPPSWPPIGPYVSPHVPDERMVPVAQCPLHPLAAHIALSLFFPRLLASSAAAGSFLSSVWTFRHLSQWPQYVTTPWCAHHSIDTVSRDNSP